MTVNVVEELSFLIPQMLKHRTADDLSFTTPAVRFLRLAKQICHLGKCHVVAEKVCVHIGGKDRKRIVVIGTP